MAGRIGRHAIGLMTAALVVALMSCARPDEVPSPDAEMQARIAQVADTLQSLADGRGPAVEPLTERMDNLCRFPPAESASRALAQALAEGLPGASVDNAISERVARHVYSLMNGGYLPRPQVERVAIEVEKELVAAGVDPGTAAAAREAGIRVAREPRHPRTDWW
jgi:hypothetical protein